MLMTRRYEKPGHQQQWYWVLLDILVSAPGGLRIQCTVKQDHTCASLSRVIIGSANGLVPIRHQAITWTNDDTPVIHWDLASELGRHYDLRNKFAEMCTGLSLSVCLSVCLWSMKIISWHQSWLVTWNWWDMIRVSHSRFVIHELGVNQSDMTF